MNELKGKEEKKIIVKITLILCGSFFFINFRFWMSFEEGDKKIGWKA